jgi:hypothetical protein
MGVEMLMMDIMGLAGGVGDNRLLYCPVDSNGLLDVKMKILT